MNKSTIKIHTLALVVIIFLQLYPNIGIADNSVSNKKNDLVEIKKNIDVINKKIKKNTEVKKTLTKELKREEKKISGTKRELYKIKKKVKKNSKNLNKLKKRLRVLNKEIKEKKKILSQHFYRTYTQGEPSQIQMILEGSNPNKISRDIEYIRLFTFSHTSTVISKLFWVDISLASREFLYILCKISGAKMSLQPYNIERVCPDAGVGDVPRFQNILFNFLNVVC